MLIRVGGADALAHTSAIPPLGNFSKQGAGGGFYFGIDYYYHYYYGYIIHVYNEVH